MLELYKKRSSHWQSLSTLEYPCIFWKLFVNHYQNYSGNNDLQFQRRSTESKLLTVQSSLGLSRTKTCWRLDDSKTNRKQWKTSEKTQHLEFEIRITHFFMYHQPEIQEFDLLEFLISNLESIMSRDSALDRILATSKKKKLAKWKARNSKN